MKYILSALLLVCSFAVRAGQQIAPDNEKIQITGALYNHMVDGRMVIDRHSDSLWDTDVPIAKQNARTQSGVKISFKTDSKTIKPLFAAREDAEKRVVTYYFGIYCNGEFVGVKGGEELLLSSPGGICDWEIMLPIFYGVDFLGLEIDDDAKMLDLELDDRPVYVAIGNSITHGAGQKKCGSEGSYPGVVAQTNGYTLYNFAVGGSQITSKIAPQTAGIKADIITIMWGFNDWNATRGDIAEISRRYTDLLVQVRKVQPGADIYCILPSVARDEVSKNAQPLSAVRDAERGIVESFVKKGDSKLFIIDGSAISNVEELNGNVHFNNEGAVNFGKAVAAQIK